MPNEAAAPGQARIDRQSREVARRSRRGIEQPSNLIQEVQSRVLTAP